MTAVRDNVICAHCNDSFTRKTSLKRHLLNSCVTSNVFKPKRPYDKVICAHCGAAFASRNSLNRHLSNRCNSMNAIKPKAPGVRAPDEKAVCAHCGDTFTRRHSLKRHLNRCIYLKAIKPKATGVQILRFSSNEEFLAWKDEEEQRSCSKFSQTYGTRESKRRKTEKTKYLCHRAGNARVKDESSRKRPLKSKGSCKINNHCSAFIWAEKFKDGAVTALYNPEHCNHPIEIKHLPLSFRDKVEFASKLEEGVPMDQILDDVRDTLCASKPLTRKQLVTKYELHNIKQEFNIDLKERSSHFDTVSVELLVDEHNKKYGTESPFLFFKQQGVEYETFDSQDILMVIMNPTQMNFLQKYGSGKICIASTHHRAGYDYLLNTILVVDDLNLSIPVAHLISNKENATFLKKFFEVIKAKCGVINCETFISDDYPAYINAWEEVMGSVENRLLCTWHIDRSWRQNLTHVKQMEGSVPVAELKNQVYSAVRSVLEETDQDLFPEVVDSLVENLENHPATKDFGAYFRNEYSKRYKMWAHAFRKHIGIDTNMKMEALYREIMNVYFKSAKNKPLNFLIISLLRMNRSKARYVLMERDSHTLRKIQQAHHESVRIPKEDIVVINDELAVVTSQSNRSTCYTITKGIDHCDCESRCAECDSICVHMYSCTCVDYTIAHNLCKHVHAFMKVRISEEVICFSDITNFEVRDDVNTSSKCEEIHIIVNEVPSESTDHLNGETNIGECMRSLVHQLSFYVRNVGRGEGNEIEKKALQHLKKAVKLLQPNEN